MDPMAVQTTSRGPVRRVLVVDDDDEWRTLFVRQLRLVDYDVAEATGAMQAMRLLLTYKPHAVVLDLVLPDGHGIEVGGAMRAIATTNRICVVAVTSSESSVRFVDPASFGARTILVKPVAVETLLAELGECFPDGCDDTLDGPPVSGQPVYGQPRASDPAGLA